MILLNLIKYVPYYIYFFSCPLNDPLIQLKTILFYCQTLTVILEIMTKVPECKEVQPQETLQQVIPVQSSVFDPPLIR